MRVGSLEDWISTLIPQRHTGFASESENEWGLNFYFRSVQEGNNHVQGSLSFYVCHSAFCAVSSELNAERKQVVSICSEIGFEICSFLNLQNSLFPY